MICEVDEEGSGTMEKLRATTNSFSLVSEYGDQDTNIHLLHAARTLFLGCNLVWVQTYQIHFELLKDCEFTDQMCNHKLVKPLHQAVSQSQFLHCRSYLLVLAGDEPSRAGGRAYSVREVSRARYLFFLVRQSAIGIAVQQTRS